MSEIIIRGFACFYLTWLLVDEDGPWKVFVRLRRLVKKPLDCFICTAVWVAAAVILLPPVPVQILAAAGLAVAVRFPVVYFQKCWQMMNAEAQ